VRDIGRIKLNGKGNQTMAGIKTLLQKLMKPKTPGGVRSVKSEIRQKVLDNPKLKGEAEKDALAEINALANKQIDAMKKADAAAKKPKGQLPKDPDKRRQSEKERSSSATGSMSAITTQAGNKPLSMGVYRSFTDKQRADVLVEAGKNLRANKITQAEFDAIEKKVDAADKAAAVAASRKAQAGATGKKKITLPDALPSRKAETSKPSGKKDPRNMTKAELAAYVKKQEEEGKKVADKFKSKRGYKRGGLTKPAADQAGLKKLPTAVRNKMGYMKSGGKVTKGHVDMRKGGLFR